MPEPNSGLALALREKFKPPIILTHLHRVELISAWQLKVFRKEISHEAVSQALIDLQEDVDSGLWLRPHYDLVDVYEHAERLIKRFSSVLGTRTLDVLHVASALELNLMEFVTNDQRQAKLAEQTGLKVSRL